MASISDWSNIKHFCWNADGVIGIGITATAVGLIAGGIAAALARKKWNFIFINVHNDLLPTWLILMVWVAPPFSLKECINRVYLEHKQLPKFDTVYVMEVGFLNMNL